MSEKNLPIRTVRDTVVDRIKDKTNGIFGQPKSINEFTTKMISSWSEYVFSSMKDDLICQIAHLQNHCHFRKRCSNCQNALFWENGVQ